MSPAPLRLQTAACQPLFLAWAAPPQISIIDGRKYDAEGDGEDVLERCELLCNKQGQPLLAHGRSGRCACERVLSGAFPRWRPLLATALHTLPTLLCYASGGGMVGVCTLA